MLDHLRAGTRQLVIGSTIMETGIDVPSMELMVVRNADCFGISQLHQLRGRLVRNGGVGTFIMFVENKDELSEATLLRLNQVAATRDGYALAEADLANRGFGNLEGDNQSGSETTLFKLLRVSARDLLGKRLQSVRIEAEQAQKMVTQDLFAFARQHPTGAGLAAMRQA